MIHTLWKINNVQFTLDRLTDVPYVKNQKINSRIRPHLLRVKAHNSFTKTLELVKNSPFVDYVLVDKPKGHQMAAVLLAKLMGKKFIWLQCFENPPTPTFLTRLLLTQADRINVSSKKDFIKLKNFGIDKGKISYLR